MDPKMIAEKLMSYNLNPDKKGKLFESGLLINALISSLDQAILSALNFLISIILIKTVTKSEYGYYAIAFSASFFLISIQNAIINTPLAVLFASKTGNERPHYIASLLLGQFLGLIPAIILGILFIFYGMGWLWAPTQQYIAASVCLAAIGLLFREFLRALFFAEQFPLKVLKIDGVYALLFIFFLACTYQVTTVGSSTMILLSGTAGLIASLFFSEKFFFSRHPGGIRESYSENWKYGRWALLGVVVSHIENHSYLYILGTLIGSAAVAEVTASRLLVMPLMLVGIGWNKIVIPYGSKMREQKRVSQFYRQQILTSFLFIGVVAAYIFILLTWSDILQRVVLSEKYEKAFTYVIYWGIIQAIGFIGINASNGLLVMKAFKGVSFINVGTMITTVCATFWLIPILGIAGSLYAVILGSSLSAISLWIYFTKTVNSFDIPAK